MNSHLIFVYTKENFFFTTFQVIWILDTHIWHYLSLSLKKLRYLKTIEKVFKSESRHKKNVRRLLCYFMIFDLV